MRRRLTLVFLIFLIGGLAALGAPLALSAQSAEQQSMFVDRLGDTTWFASLAQRPLLDADYEDLHDQLERYDQLYGIPTLVLDASGRVVVTSRPGPALPAVLAIDTALAGRETDSVPRVWPWDSGPMVLAEPVVTQGRVLGAAVTLSPTGALRGRIAIEWGLLVLGGVFLVLLAALAVGPLVAWILGPVRRLETRIAEVADAAEAGREPTAATTPRGPPEFLEVSRAFDRLGRRIAALLALQRAFVADASHQLRNPLTALQIRMESMVERVPEAVLDDHASAMREVDRLATVVDGLLTLARAEHDATPAEDCAVDDALERRTGAWSALAETEEVVLRRTGSTGLSVRAAPEVLDAVLDVLLDNAVRFGPPGTDVELGAERVDGSVLVRVRDHGPGLSPEQRERALDRFWRAAGQESSGSGLGLPIAASLAGRNGGSLQLCAPEGGSGLEVVLTLPAGEA